MYGPHRTPKYQTVPPLLDAVVINASGNKSIMIPVLSEEDATKMMRAVHALSKNH
jgi:hypothetical protein